MTLRYVSDRGPEDSPFVIVGEAPGKQEVKEGKVFVGPSGQVLNFALNDWSKGSYPEPFITNAIPHFINATGDNKQAILSKLVVDNHKELIDKIKKHPRKAILALGNAALWALTGNPGLKITQCRGKLFRSELAEQGIVAATHPAYLLRGNGSLRQFRADVTYAIDLASGGKPHEFVPPTWEYVDNPEKARRFVEMMRAHKGICAGDIETKGFSFRTDTVLMAGFTIDGNHVYVIPGTKREYLAVQNQLDNVAGMWDSEAQFSWHNGKFDVKFLRYQHKHKARVDDDTMLMSYALDEMRGIHDLETVSGDYLGSPNWKKELDQHKQKNQSYDVIPEPVLVKYMAYDIANTFRLTRLLGSLVSKDAKSTLQYRKTLIPASEFLAKMEWNGLLVDPVRVEENRARLQAAADVQDAIMQEIAISVGFGPINCNSPIQLSNLLFNTMKMPRKFGVSTSVDILEKLPQTPFIVALRAHRKIFKALSTYVTPVAKNTDDDGRIHSSYLIHGTATGRLASRDPNLQNIPRDPQIRGQFVPPPGKCYVDVDLNQAELRSLAALSGDPVLCAIYNDPNSEGLHEVVRASIYGMYEDWSEAEFKAFQRKWYIPDQDHELIKKLVLKEQKMRAKNVNFGIIYGITAAGLSEQIEDSPNEALRMLSAWGKKFPVAWGFIESCRGAALRGQNITTVFGYRKRFQIVTPETYVSIQNESANFPHQSTASTITLHGGIRMFDTLKKRWDTDIVNIVHDSLLMECPLDRTIITEASEYARGVLEQIPVDYGITRIPFKAEAEAGMRWGSTYDLDKFFEMQGL